MTGMSPDFVGQGGKFEPDLPLNGQPMQLSTITTAHFFFLVEPT